MNDTVKPPDVIEDVDEPGSYNFRQLLDLLADSPDIIVTIPSDQEQELKDGLQARKAKDNHKLKKSGLLPPAEMLSFASYPAKDEAGKVKEGQIEVRIKLVPRKSIEILKIQVPDPSF